MIKKWIIKSFIGIFLFVIVSGIGFEVKHYFTSEPLLVQHTKLIENNSNDIKNFNAKIDSTQPVQIRKQVKSLQKEFKEFKKEVKENEKDRKQDHKDVMKYIIDIYKNTPKNNTQ